MQKTSIEMMIRRIDHVVIFVTDMDEAIAFYTEKLGFDLVHKSPEYTSLDTGGETGIGLHIAENVGGIDSGMHTTQVSFLVDDIEQTLKTLRNKDVRITREIDEIAPGRFVFNFTDPDGNQLSCYELRK